MLGCGGTDSSFYYNSGASCDPLADKRTPITINNSGLLGRSTHGAVWTGFNMILLNGSGFSFASCTNLSDGPAFTPRKVVFLCQKPKLKAES
jgi:hypothetical protein